MGVNSWSPPWQVSPSENGVCPLLSNGPMTPRGPGPAGGLGELSDPTHPPPPGLVLLPPTALLASAQHLVLSDVMFVTCPAENRGPACVSSVHAAWNTGGAVLIA